MKTRIGVAVLIGILALAGNVHAEVMDKEPSLLLNLIWGISSMIVCFLSARYKPSLLFLFVPVSSIYFFGLMSEIQDSSVGPAIFAEAGLIYVMSVYLLYTLLLAGIVSGLRLRKRVQNKLRAST